MAPSSVPELRDLNITPMSGRNILTDCSPISPVQIEPPWTKVVTKTGRVYYYNTCTFETRWQPPTPITQSQFVSPKSSFEVFRDEEFQLPPVNLGPDLSKEVARFLISETLTPSPVRVPDSIMITSVAPVEVKEDSRGPISKISSKYQNFKNKHLSKFKEPLFGGNLENLMLESKLPSIMGLCTEFIELHAPNAVGIYRVSGNTASIKSLKQQFINSGVYGSVSLKNADLSTVTGILKLFLRELKVCLLVSDLYPEWIKAGKTQGQERFLMIQSLIEKIPKKHYIALHFIITHLKTIVKYQDTTKMCASNLSIVFGPTLLRPNVETIETAMNSEAHNSIIRDMITHDFFK